MQDIYQRMSLIGVPELTLAFLYLLRICTKMWVMVQDVENMGGSASGSYFMCMFCPVGQYRPLIGQWHRAYTWRESCVLELFRYLEYALIHMSSSNDSNAKGQPALVFMGTVKLRYRVYACGSRYSAEI